MIARPHYYERIRPFIGKRIIKVLVGVRRCGKSTLLDMLRARFVEDGFDEGDILHMSFESSKYAGIETHEQLVAYVGSRIDADRPVKLLFDEIQEVDGWEKALRSFLVDYDADIYITGSNARVLSSDLATYVTGRYVTVDVYPLSFSEFLPAYRASHAQADARTAFRAYVAQGGFPFQGELEFDADATLMYLGDVFSTILLKDIVKRNGIRDIDLLERTVRYAISEEGHILSVKSVADYLKSERRKASQETVASYLDAAEKAYLLYRVRREDAAGKRILAFSEKFYVVDQGLRHALGMDNAAAIDQVLEGIVFMELRRRGYSVTVGRIGVREVDFIARRDGGIEYYQVSYLAADERTREREFGALEAIADSYPKFVLTLDDFPFSRNGIKGVNIVDWLLGGE